MEERLASLDDELASIPPKPPRQPTKLEVMRAKVAEEVAAARQRSHRITGDLSTESMLRDIGPGLWVSVNPGYSSVKQSSTTHSTHISWYNSEHLKS